MFDMSQEELQGILRQLEQAFYNHALSYER